MLALDCAIGTLFHCVYCCLQTAAVRTSVHDVSNAVIEEKMECWLRQARDRDGGRKRRYEAAEARKRQRMDQEAQQPPSDDDEPEL